MISHTANFFKINYQTVNNIIQKLTSEVNLFLKCNKKIKNSNWKMKRFKRRKFSKQSGQRQKYNQVQGNVAIGRKEDSEKNTLYLHV